MEVIDYYVIASVLLGLLIILGLDKKTEKEIKQNTVYTVPKGTRAEVLVNIKDEVVGIAGFTPTISLSEELRFAKAGKKTLMYMFEGYKYMYPSDYVIETIIKAQCELEYRGLDYELEDS